MRRSSESVAALAAALAKAQAELAEIKRRRRMPALPMPAFNPANGEIKLN